MPGGTIYFSFLKMIHTGSAVHLASHSMSTRVLSRGRGGGLLNGVHYRCHFMLCNRLIGFVPRTLLPFSLGNNSLSLSTEI